MASAFLTPSKSEAVQVPRSRGLSRVLVLVFSALINYTDLGNLAIAAPLIKDELGISASSWAFCSRRFSGPMEFSRFCPAGSSTG